jgi:hypothetical protein
MSPTPTSLRGPLRPSRGPMPHPPTASPPPRSVQTFLPLILPRRLPALHAWRSQPSGQCLSPSRGPPAIAGRSDSALVRPCA